MSEMEFGGGGGGGYRSHGGGWGLRDEFKEILLQTENYAFYFYFFGNEKTLVVDLQLDKSGKNE